MDKALKTKEFILRVGIKSLDELAKKLGVKPITVYAWTNGSRKPGWDMIYALYELGMTTEEIFGKAYPSSTRYSHDELVNAVTESLERAVRGIGKI
ncbi:MAG: helix-turn-helix transcriptional regulator [Bacteroidaceae bacterium]|nr:helix-turn-helix transcriptional regulator [Bacteroidaceae bacterium]